MTNSDWGNPQLKAESALQNSENRQGILFWKEWAWPWIGKDSGLIYLKALNKLPFFSPESSGGITASEKVCHGEMEGILGLAY